MTAQQAREWLLLASLLATGALFLFLLTAHAFGYPLAFHKALPTLQAVTPVFLGYAGSAAHFVFRPKRPTVSVAAAQRRLLRLLVKGPVYLFAIGIASALGVFGWSNRPGLADGSGMTLEDLGIAITAALAFLTAVTSVVVAYLFASAEHESSSGKKKA